MACVKTSYTNLNILLCTYVLNVTRRYGPLYGPTSSSCGGLWPLAEAFIALRAKKEVIMLFWPIFGIFLCPVLTLVTFSSNINNFERNSKKTLKKKQKNPKNSKNLKKSKNVQKSNKSKKIQKKFHKNLFKKVQKSPENP